MSFFLWRVMRFKKIKSERSLLLHTNVWVSSSALHSFLKIQVSVWCHFLSVWQTFYSIFLSVGLLVTHSVFLLSENVFISLSCVSMGPPLPFLYFCIFYSTVFWLSYSLVKSQWNSPFSRFCSFFVYRIAAIKNKDYFISSNIFTGNLVF